jgi:hypothetical protein
MSEANPMAEDMKALEPLKDTPIAPAHGIAALALNMALKYHDIGMVKDGALYQQYKLEGRNFETLHLDMVFETAIKMEAYLLGSSDRIAKIVVDAIEFGVAEDAPAEGHEDGEAPRDR